MKLAIAGDSAGEGLAKVLADHLKDRHEVHEISRTSAGPDDFYADLSDRVASGVLDVSETGARLLLDKRLADGAEFEVNFEGPGSKPVKVLANVVWTVETADGRFVTGVHFQK